MHSFSYLLFWRFLWVGIQFACGGGGVFPRVSLRPQTSFRKAAASITVFTLCTGEGSISLTVLSEHDSVQKL